MLAQATSAETALRTLPLASKPATRQPTASPPPSYQPPARPSDYPEVYAMICDGECMHPFYKHGQTLVFSKTEPWQPGDSVLLFRRPEFLAPGDNQFYFKQLLMAPSADYWSNGSEPPQRRSRKAPISLPNVKPIVMVRMWNPERVITFDAAHLYGIHKLIGTMAGDKLIRL